MTTSAAYPSLSGKVALVTGGASGIGAEIVRRFAEQGTAVGFIDLLQTEGEALARLLSKDGARIAFVRADVTDIPALRRAIGDIRTALGSIDILVNNAANDQRHPAAEVTPQEWDDRMAVNLKHQFFAIQAVMPDMKTSGRGSVINMSSTAWPLGVVGMPAYTAAKAAVMGLTKSMARELGPFGIRVNTVLPGWIMTERQLKLWVTPKDDELILQQQCLKRKLVPDDIARVVMFLASDEAAGCTSQSFVVDGGWT
jgi:NAD(P)-dependent dehydrogenase (short-subunit alcohol dehydrogenase family)